MNKFGVSAHNPAALAIARAISQVRFDTIS